MKLTTAFFCVGLMISSISFSASGQSLQDIVRDASQGKYLLVDAAFRSEQEQCSALASQGTEETAVAIPRLHAASISKLFTAIAIFQLRDEGLLQLSDPAGRYEPLCAESTISLQQLLTHESGLRDRDRADSRMETAEVERYFAKLARQQPRAMKGVSWHYADAGFNLLGRVIEQITGQSFGQVIKTRILDPSGMSNSSFDANQIDKDSLVRVANRRGKPRPHPWDLAFVGSSGLQTTAADLLEFSATILADARTDRGVLLSAASLEEMTSPQASTRWPGISQGYAWQLAESDAGPVWRHAGGEAGFESLLTIYPQEGISIVVLGNQPDWPRFELEEQIRKAIQEGRNLCAP